MGYIEDSLTPGEKVVAHFDLHWKVWIGPVVLTLLIVTIPIAIYQWLKLRSHEYGVTTKRVVHKWGIIGRETDEMQISSLETVEISQPAMGRILGYGEVQLTGRGTSDLNLTNMAGPLEVKKKIESVRFS
jgi:membrane protein YdbS with pleckstrin-like domain